MKKGYILFNKNKNKYDLNKSYMLVSEYTTKSGRPIPFKTEKDDAIAVMSYLINVPANSIKDIFFCINQYIYTESTLLSVVGRAIINVADKSKEVASNIDNNYLVGFVEYDENLKNQKFFLYKTLTIEQAKELYYIL